MTVAADEQKRAVSPSAEKTMKRVVVDHFGGPRGAEDGGGRCSRTGAGRGPREGAGCRRVVHRFPAARGHVSRRAEPPFTPATSSSASSRSSARLLAAAVGGRIAALTVWGACAEFACVLEADAVEVPEDLDPAEVVGLVLTYMTAYQVLHREAGDWRGDGARARRGRQGGHGGARARRARRASPLRDLFGS